MTRCSASAGTHLSSGIEERFVHASTLADPKPREHRPDGSTGLPIRCEILAAHLQTTCAASIELRRAASACLLVYIPSSSEQRAAVATCLSPAEQVCDQSDKLRIITCTRSKSSYGRSGDLDGSDHLPVSQASVCADAGLSKLTQTGQYVQGATVRPLLVPTTLEKLGCHR